MYGRHRSIATGSPSFFLDGNLTRIVLNGTTSGDEVSPVYYANNLEDGDHQLMWLMDKAATPIEMAYFECVVPLLYSVLRTMY